MTLFDFFIKRAFDIVLSGLLILLLAPLIFVCWFIASVDTRSNGLFKQKRIGRFGNSFYIFKIKTMYDTNASRSSITSLNKTLISRSGIFFRKSKLDELPQLFNIFFGHMSFVGPRPDVPGYADLLIGTQRDILLIRPGITSLASIKYRNEEHILSLQSNPVEYNDTIIWPDKVRMNLDYINNYKFIDDLLIIFKTVKR
jgi:lipopolysaccharide/colanic/teichoic acid biosynthesis glycosyltransferase